MNEFNRITPHTQIITHKGGTLIEVYQKDRLSYESTNLIPVLSDLNSRAFKLQIPTTEKETKDRLDQTDVLFLAKSEEELIGFANYQVLNLNGATVLYQSRGILEGSQNKGLGRYFTKLAIDMFNADILSAKSQNPNSIWSAIRAGVLKEVFPIDRLYSESNEIMTILKLLIEKRGKTGEVDLDTGLHRASYPMGKLGDYSIDLSHPGIAGVEKRLQEIGLNRLLGDAIYYMGKVVK